jgi:hypothetical protein
MTWSRRRNSVRTSGGAKYLAQVAECREYRGHRLDSHVCPYRAEPKTRIAQHRSWEQPGLEQDLEAVADPEDYAVSASESLYFAHHGRETGDSTCSEVVTVREAARQDQRVVGSQVGSFVPDQIGAGVED